MYVWRRKDFEDILIFAWTTWKVVVEIEKKITFSVAHEAIKTSFVAIEYETLGLVVIWKRVETPYKTVRYVIPIGWYEYFSGKFAIKNRIKYGSFVLAG